MKRVFVVHGWGGNPDEAWMPWLDRELTSRGWEVHRLAMPHPDEPAIDEWVSTLADAVGTPDTDTHFVGHSIGVQTVLRYVAGLDVRVGKVVSVAGWYTLANLEPGEEPRAKLWIEAPLDNDQARANAAAILAIFSDDDEVVPLENVGFFRDRLGAKTIVEHNKGHFSQDSGVTELPAALEFLIKETSA